MDVNCNLTGLVLLVSHLFTFCPPALHCLSAGCSGLVRLPEQEEQHSGEGRPGRSGGAGDPASRPGAHCHPERRRYKVGAKDRGSICRFRTDACHVFVTLNVELEV